MRVCRPMYVWVCTYVYRCVRMCMRVRVGLYHCVCTGGGPRILEGGGVGLSGELAVHSGARPSALAGVHLFCQ